MASRIETIVPGPTPERLITGIAGLDSLLGGGFLRQNSILLRGTPGSGKSALGMEIIANGASQFGESGIILSFELFPELLYRDARSFGWDFRALEKAGNLRVIFARRDDLYSSFAEKESAAMTQITDASIDLGARRVLIDSANQFWRLPMPAEEQQKIFFEFVMKLKGLGLTPILTADCETGDSEFGTEEFAIDTILMLTHGPAAFSGSFRNRTLEVVKSRGQNAAEGRHPFRISSVGIHVTPCLQVVPVPAEEEYCLAGRMGTGVADLDEILKGGFHAGSTTMIAGITGTGKTTLAAHFMAAGLQTGQPGVFVTLNERPASLIRSMDQRGLGFSEAVDDGRLKVIQASPMTMLPVELLALLDEAIAGAGAVRVVIDGLRDLTAFALQASEREYLWSLFEQLFHRRQCTALVIWRVDEISGVSSIAGIPHGSSFDNILYVGMMEYQSRLRKVISVFKTRGEESDSNLRELIITGREVRISNLLSGLSGIMKGSAEGQVSQEGQEILDVMVRIRDFVNGAQAETSDQARLMTTHLREEFDILATKIRGHFGARERLN